MLRGLKAGFDETQKRLLAIVYGMKIYSDSVYVITGKHDEAAPTGFQENGISKTPFPGNKSIVPCAWDKFLHVYDTGFFKNSACYKGYTAQEREEEVQRRIENIRAPYEEATGNDLDQRNFDFWDSLTVADYMGRLFYTNDIQDLFELYISLQSKLLTPKDQDGNPMFQSSMYCVEDKTTAVDIKKQRQLDKTDIIYDFMSMLKGTPAEKQQIKDLLLYLGIIRTVNLDENMIRYTFTNWIESRNVNIDQYKEAYSRFISEDMRDAGPQAIRYHRMITEMVYGGALQYTASGLSIDGLELGPDAITAAHNLAYEPSFSEQKGKVVELYTSMQEKHERAVRAKVDAGRERLEAATEKPKQQKDFPVKKAETPKENKKDVND